MQSLNEANSCGIIDVHAAASLYVSAHFSLKHTPLTNSFVQLIHILLLLGHLVLPRTFTHYPRVAIPPHITATTPTAAAVGTVQVRSLVEPIRKIIAKFRGHFIEGRAIDISMKDQLVEIESTDPSGKKNRLYVPCALSSTLMLITRWLILMDDRYDKLVIAVGSSTSTHGVPGLENCFQLKSIRDAQMIRRRIMGEWGVSFLLWVCV